MIKDNAETNLLVSNDAYLAGSICRHLWKNLTCLSRLNSADASIIVYIWLWKAMHLIISGSFNRPKTTASDWQRVASSERLSISICFRRRIYI